MFYELGYCERCECLGGLNPCSNGICSMRRHEGQCLLRLRVLILVLMEYVLWGLQDFWNWNERNGVLILVLMEYVLWVVLAISIAISVAVLILVLMEYVLWGRGPFGRVLKVDPRLNPCSNGICSMRSYQRHVVPIRARLNPCSNGICSMST